MVDATMLVDAPLAIECAPPIMEVDRGPVNPSQ